MKKFKFKLQKLLEMREAKEKKIENELAVIIGKQNVERTKQTNLRELIKKQQVDFRERMQKNKFSSKEVLLFEKFVNISYRAIDVSEKKIIAMEPAVAEVRGRLIKASIEKKVVEKLKEKKLEEFTYNLNREIAKENDDMNQKIFFRRRAFMEGE